MYHPPQNLVFLDLEMTGLDPQLHAILQIAIIITTNNLQILEQKMWYVSCLEEKLTQMNSVVKAMHTKTGLLEKIATSGLPLEVVEQEIVKWLKNQIAPEAIMCGNSIWADRKFIEVHMKKLNSLFHYRMVDISSLKVLFSMWDPKNLYNKPDFGKHDALFDIQESINELKHYKSIIFK